MNLKSLLFCKYDLTETRIIVIQQSNKEVFRRQKMKKASHMDKDEKELIKSLENEEWVSDLTKKEKKQYQEYALYSLNKRKRINIRMTERDLKKIRAKAIEEGIPYQSLISMLIHKYNEGKISVNR
jgi:predicted DNA binding CopG/RHH family protein